MVLLELLLSRRYPYHVVKKRHLTEKHLGRLSYYRILYLILYRILVMSILLGLSTASSPYIPDLLLVMSPMHVNEVSCVSLFGLWLFCPRDLTQHEATKAGTLQRLMQNEIANVALCTDVTENKCDNVRVHQPACLVRSAGLMIPSKSTRECMCRYWSMIGQTSSDVTFLVALYRAMQL